MGHRGYEDVLDAYSAGNTNVVGLPLALTVRMLGTYYSINWY